MEKATEILYQINKWRERVIGGYEEMEPSGVDIISMALRTEREAAIDEAANVVLRKFTSCQHIAEAIRALKAVGVNQAAG